MLLQLVTFWSFSCGVLNRLTNLKAGAFEGRVKISATPGPVRFRAAEHALPGSKLHFLPEFGAPVSS